LSTGGVPLDAPLGRTRYVVAICRQVWRRERVRYDGKHYQIPLPPGRGTGLGKPLRLINHPVRDQWADAATTVSEHIQTRTGLPVFIKGSSLGASAAYCAYAASDVFAGAILMGFAIPSSPLVPHDNPFRAEAFEQMVAHRRGDRLPADEAVGSAMDGHHLLDGRGDLVRLRVQHDDVRRR
jgi:hypothetical protein